LQHCECFVPKITLHHPPNTHISPKISSFDDGTGRNIERCGGPFCQPKWSCLALYQDPAIVQQVHEAFLESGATTITTKNTFAIVTFHIGQEHYNKDWKFLLELAVRLAKQARDSYCERKKQEHVSRGQSW
jgi:S-methylmethionine-dependent homocysteine/selenocysteine methylase